MKTKLLALTTVVLIGTGFISGCNNSASGNEKKSKSKMDGEYKQIENYSKLADEEYLSDFDAAIEKVKDEDALYSVIIDDNEFEIIYNHLPLEKYSGIVNNDEELKFEYQKASLNYNINDEVDNIINADIDDDTEGISGQEKSLLENMKRMNNSGTFAYTMLPVVSLANDIYLTRDGEIPFFLARHRISNCDDSYPTMLKYRDDFLCMDIYGMKLDSKYNYGKDFIIEFDVLAPYVIDEYSYTNMSQDEKILEEKKGQLKNLVTGGSDDFSTTIEFHDGEWEWYNSSGELINNGKYQESKQYEGLLEMYFTEDSKKYYEVFTKPLFLYIDENSEIYSPVFIKCD